MTYKPKKKNIEKLKVFLKKKNKKKSKQWQMKSIIQVGGVALKK